jgi:cephalosporin hydroxylase
MTDTKISKHLFHQEFFEHFNTLEQNLQTAVLEVTPNDDPSVTRLRTEAPRDWTSPELLANQKFDWISRLAQVFDRRARLERERPRFVPFLERECVSVPGNPWGLVMGGNWGAGMHYKGLLNVKSPMDLALYSMLIWELKPATIIELGSLQGGSALWLADQMQSQLGAGAVHSFDINSESVSERAKHPLLTFHQADLRRLETLDSELFRKLEHPWLIIDDAHTNVFNVLDWISQFMTTGDYYIIEDVVAALPPVELGQLLSSKNLLVDTFYCDNFGFNCTISPNGWLRRM